ncbi:MAG: Mlc titration factor MtfA (ptsG expression regulator) [Pirellulaceae bacterium]
MANEAFLRLASSRTLKTYISMFGLFKSFRRRSILNQPMPAGWNQFLADLYHYDLLDGQQKEGLHRRMKIIVAEKNWEGCEGLEITEQMKVTIAAQCSIMLLGVDPSFYYDKLTTILVYPNVIERKRREVKGMIETNEKQILVGEAWQGGPVILSWAEILDDRFHARDHRNLVVHEFAHHLDGMDGEMGGTPPLESLAATRHWLAVFGAAYDEMVLQLKHGISTFLDPYGATSPAEFFAVSSECFFMAPQELRTAMPDVYQQLCGFYKQDPTTWNT